MKNLLVETAARMLDLSTRFDVLNEGTEEHTHMLSKNVHDFLSHLSSSIPGDIGINEAVVFDINSRPRSPASFNTPQAFHTKHEWWNNGNFPKTKRIIDKGKEEGLDKQNIHMQVKKGMGPTFEKLNTEHPDETKQHLKTARKVFKEFAQSRGYKNAPKSILGGNTKTRKSSGEGVYTTGLNLAPHGLSGHNVCPNASTECRANCLGTETGHNKIYQDNALSSKVMKNHFIVKHPEHAARLIDHAIGEHTKEAKSLKMKPGVRMNVTSDIAWEKHAPQLFHRHPNVQFYDYTKVPDRVHNQSKLEHPANYHLSLSHTGTGHSESNDHHIAKALENGHVVASVFHGKELPKHAIDMSSGKKYHVVNGDHDDNTFDRQESVGKTPLKPGHGVISGLKFKALNMKKADPGKFANHFDKDNVFRFNYPKK